MINIFKILLIFTFVLQASCGNEKKISTIAETDIREQMVGLYEEGYDELLKETQYMQHRNSKMLNQFFHNQIGHQWLP